MIEFKGQLSDASLRPLLRESLRTCVHVTGVLLLIMGTPAVFFIIQPPAFLNHLQAACYSACYLLMVIAVGMLLPTPNPFRKKEARAIFPSYLAVTDDEIVLRCDKYSKLFNIPLENVIKVQDYGIYYKIIIGTSRHDWIVCEKNNIATGTLEDFEALFAEKMEHASSGERNK